MSDKSNQNNTENIFSILVKIDSRVSEGIEETQSFTVSSDAIILSLAGNTVYFGYVVYELLCLTLHFIARLF